MPRHRSRSRHAGRIGHAPRTPAGFRHHTWVHDVDRRVFDTVLRSLQQRLFDGRVRDRDGIRTATLRQGPAHEWTRGWLLGGLIGLLCAALAASELGRDLRQRAQDGGVIDAAVSIVVGAVSSPAFAGLALAACAAGILAVRNGCKHVWLTAFPAADPERCHLWLAGTSSRDAERFAREFATLAAGAQAAPEPLQPERQSVSG